MQIRKTPVVMAALVALSLLAAACGSSSSTPTTTTTTAAPAASKNIVHIATADPQLSTLVTAVKAAGLVGTLEGPGPYTVFAPTNAAFAALPAGTVSTLLEPANKTELTSILTYHVVPGKVLAADLKAGPVTTVNGATFTVNSANGTFTITDGKGGTAHFVTTDIQASNGVIHVIDAVLMPPA